MVATPGRLIDYAEGGELDLTKVENNLYVRRSDMVSRHKRNPSFNFFSCLASSLLKSFRLSPIALLSGYLPGAG